MFIGLLAINKRGYFVTIKIIDQQEQRWVFGLRGSNFGWSLGDGSAPAGPRGRAPGGSLVAKLPETEETLQIVNVRKVFSASVTRGVKASI